MNQLWRWSTQEKDRFQGFCKLPILYTNSCIYMCEIQNQDHITLYNDTRMIAYEGYEWCGCGGTHIRSSGEIGKIEIKKVKKKGGNIRISYGVIHI